MGRKTVNLGEELGFTAQEMGQLQKAKELQTTVVNAHQHLTPSMKESCKLYENAQKILKPYKEFMSELQVRELIHQTGVRTFPRPPGIPENFRVKILKKGAGMIYVHPNHTHTSVRVMPGKPHSSYPHQQKPYINHIKDGQALDRFGNIVKTDSPEAHIPYEEFVYRN